MKHLRLLFLMLCIIPMLASAMKIEKDEIDEFTGKRTVITSWESICNKNISIRFRMQNGINILDFKMFYNGAIVISNNDELLFKSTTDSIVSFMPNGTYSGTIGGGATGLMGSGAWGITAAYEGNFSFFSDNTIRLMRIYSSDGYIDKKLSDSDGKKLQRLYELFSMTISGEQGTSAFMNYKVVFLKSKNGGKKWEEIKTEYYEDFTKDELQTIVDAWKAQSSGEMIYECQVKKDK